jgi:hypothetical protein
MLGYSCACIRVNSVVGNESLRSSDGTVGLRIGEDACISPGSIQSPKIAARSPQCGVSQSWTWCDDHHVTVVGDMIA